MIIFCPNFFSRTFERDDDERLLVAHRAGLIPGPRRRPTAGASPSTWIASPGVNFMSQKLRGITPGVILLLTFFLPGSKFCSTT